MGRECVPEFRARRCSKCRLRASSLGPGWRPVGAVERLSLARNYSQRVQPQLAYLFPPWRLDASIGRSDTSRFADTSFLFLPSPNIARSIPNPSQKWDLSVGMERSWFAVPFGLLFVSMLRHRAQRDRGHRRYLGDGCKL